MILSREELIATLDALRIAVQITRGSSLADPAAVTALEKVTSELQAVEAEVEAVMVGIFGDLGGALDRLSIRPVGERGEV